ncbi:MAG: lysylphosphatidylglycerol synthase transmembrane domain-containing protein [Desulfatibacillaceae bacterium]|nr:lysylphosphatidylglycerol synthase transmembrane domain-containing protein [Desulfatibacillaceae bacterium]
MRNKSLSISLAIGVLLSATALYFALKPVPFGELAGYVRTVNYWWIAPALAVAVVGFVLRVIRWRIILSSTVKISFWDAFHPMMVGFMMNCVLPGRVGELARPVILRQRNRASFMAVLATVAAERVFDLIILMGLFLVVALSVPIDPAFEMQFGQYTLNKAALETIALSMARLMALLIVFIALLSINRTRLLCERAVMAAPNYLFFLPGRAKTWLRLKACVFAVGTMEHMAKGFDAVKSPGRLAACLLLSAGVWILTVVFHVILSQGFLGLELSFLEWTAVTVVVCFFIMLPSAPGFWGLWEAGGVFALLLFGVGHKEAAAFTLINHVAQILPPIVLGAISAGVLGISITRLADESRKARLDENPPSCNSPDKTQE